MTQPKTGMYVIYLIAALLLAASGGAHWKYGINGIGVFGSYASVIGLIVTFYVAESVRSVRGRYSIRVTLMQNFERLRTAVREFEEASKAVDFQAIAASLGPLVKELSLHLPHEDSVQSLQSSLRELTQCEPRIAQSMKPQVAFQLRTLQSQIEIQRTKDEWRRDDV